MPKNIKIIAGTKKGMVRKTARRAYEKKDKTGLRGSKKPTLNRIGKGRMSIRPVIRNGKKIY